MSLNWKDKLADQVPANWGQEIDSFDAQIALRKQGKIDEKVFAETRLRRGIAAQDPVTAANPEIAFAGNGNGTVARARCR